MKKFNDFLYKLVKIGFHHIYQTHKYDLLTVSGRKIEKVYKGIGDYDKFVVRIPKK